LASNAAVSELSNRYASALFDLADEQKQLDTVADDLRALAQHVTENADLARLVSSPVLDCIEQGAAMGAIMEASGASTLTTKFVGLIARNRRLSALTDMISAFLAELARRRGEATAEVTAARALSDEQITELTESLQNTLGGKVTVEHRVDPELIGGMIVKVGSRMVDTTLQTQLTKMRIAMKGAS
jgi:F-type H+-transporting ATPase subunit delta